MKIIDTHCDTLCHIADRGVRLAENNCHVDLARMRGYDAYAQVFACFIADEYKDAPMKRLDELVSAFKHEVSGNAEKIVHCRTYAELQSAWGAGRSAAFLSLENSESVHTARDVEYLAENGFIMATLTWNGSNHLAGGAHNTLTGLTPIGGDIVREYESAGIIIDVSHLNERSFWDVLRTAKRAPIASHSNFSAVCRNPRNLTDDQFRAIIDSGGYVGLNFYPPFLANSGEAGISDILKMIDHAVNLGGENFIGLGADFDGVGSLPKNITGIESLNELFAQINDKDLCKKIAYSNFQRYLQDNM